MSNLQLHVAGAPELVRSNQKDRFYTNHIHSLLSDISHQVLPLRVWMIWEREIQLLAEITYYGLTTVYGNQTLGEEYCNTIQIGPNQSSAQTTRYTPPGFLRRTLAILLQIGGPYLIEKSLETLYQRIRDRELASLQLSEQQYQVLEKIVGFVEEVFNTCSRLHLALFYLQGLFYHLGKRIAGVRYLMIRYGMDSDTNTQGNSRMDTYRILGWLIIIQLCVKLVKWIYNKKVKHYLTNQEPTGVSARTDRESGPKIVMESLSRGTGSHQCVSQFKCPLCLELCVSQTATPCGHVFCWQCIAEWASGKMECPICRSGIEPQQLVCLQHFNH